MVVSLAGDPQADLCYVSLGCDRGKWEGDEKGVAASVTFWMNRAPEMNGFMSVCNIAVLEDSVGRGNKLMSGFFSS